jgi:putative radical SAM enzyme (TIGR03279 family)
MPVVRIGRIESGSIAEALDLTIGTRIVRINGERVRDAIDLTFLGADIELEIETVDPDGVQQVLEIVRDEGDSLGIVPEPDKIRECSNECVFCFIDGNPPYLRDSIHIRDDDFRLSFIYGSYVTLTNLGPRGLQRLVDQRLSPLYVSVHATEPDIRIRLLKNDRAGQIMEDLQFLLDNGIDVHTQVVLCPGWNDMQHLDRTMEDLYSLGAGVRTLSVVPVGLTKYNVDRPVRLLTANEAADAVEQVDRVRTRAVHERGYGWCYAADELFLASGIELPPSSYYDDLLLVENGVGVVRRFLDDFEVGIRDLPDLHGRRLRIFTGTSMEPFFAELAPRVATATGAKVEVLAVRNQLYGATVTIAGLLGGRDFLAAVTEPSEQDLILIPASALNDDGLFIDSVTLENLQRALHPAQVIPGHELTEALRDL